MIYLDAAATTLQKPPAVMRAMAHAVNHMASPGRGGYPAAMKAADTVFACREAAGTLFHVSNPEQVVLTSNATHGLNIAIFTLVRPGDTVVISGYEHNAVTRALAAIPNVTVKVAAAPLFCPEKTLEAFQAAITSDVSCVICNHVSNVFGSIQPVEKIAALCRTKNIPFILDASQSAGTLPVHMDTLQAAFIAMPGHKGLYGPQGTGLLLCNAEPRPLLYGGTGSASQEQKMPEFLPDRLEAGTHNVPGAAGLLEGIRFVMRKQEHRILEHEQRLLSDAAAGLKHMMGVECFYTDRPDAQTGVLSFRIQNADCETIGERLGEKGVAVRAGLHCSPLAHETAGTIRTGTVRISVSAFNDAHQIDLFLSKLEQCLSHQTGIRP